MNTPSLQIAPWLNGIALVIFLGMEIFWHVEQKRGIRNIPSLLIGFFIYNLPFWLLAFALLFKRDPEGWTEVLRFAFLFLFIPVNLWLHYHGDKGGNSVGMASVFFLMVSVPLILIIEIFIALY